MEAGCPMELPCLTPSTTYRTESSEASHVSSWKACAPTHAERIRRVWVLEGDGSPG